MFCPNINPKSSACPVDGLIEIFSAVYVIVCIPTVYTIIYIRTMYTGKKGKKENCRMILRYI